MFQFKWKCIDTCVNQQIQSEWVGSHLDSCYLLCRCLNLKTFVHIRLPVLCASALRFKSFKTGEMIWQQARRTLVMWYNIIIQTNAIHFKNHNLICITFLLTSTYIGLSYYHSVPIYSLYYNKENILGRFTKRLRNVARQALTTRTRNVCGQRVSFHVNVIVGLIA